MAQGIHQVHFEMVGSADGSEGNSLTEMNWAVQTQEEYTGLRHVDIASDITLHHFLKGCHNFGHK